METSYDVTKTIERLRGLFPKGIYPNGESAFDHVIPWARRIARVTRLIRDLRKEGDVYVVCRRMNQPDEFIFVARQKESA
jgi:hypothetical protein